MAASKVCQDWSGKGGPGWDALPAGMPSDRAGLRLIVFEPFTLWDTVRALSGASVFLVEDIVTVRICVAEVCVAEEEVAGAGSCAAIGVDPSRGNGRSGVAHHSES